MAHKKLQGFALVSLLLTSFLWNGFTPAFGAIEDDEEVKTEEVTTPVTEDRKKFDNTAARITADAALGDEVALLPGPNINFNDLLKVIITWSVSLASSVALFKFITNSFLAIRGTEDDINRMKEGLIKSLIGLALIMFSYVIVSFVMGIIWAT